MTASALVLPLACMYVYVYMYIHSDMNIGKRASGHALTEARLNETSGLAATDAESFMSFASMTTAPDGARLAGATGVCVYLR